MPTSKKDMYRRVSALRQFRRRRAKYGLTKRSTPHGMILGDSLDPRSKAEAVLDYYIEGGSLSSIFDVLSGREIEIKDVTDFSDAVNLAIIDGGLEDKLVEVEIDYDEACLYIYFDDRISGKESEPISILKKFGDVVLVANPEDRPELGAYVYKLSIPTEIYRKSRPIVKTSGGVIDTAKTTESKLYVWRDNPDFSISEHITKYISSEPRPYVDREGGMAMMVVTDVDLVPYFESNKIEYYTRNPHVKSSYLYSCTKCGVTIYVEDENANAVCVHCNTRVVPATEAWSRLAESELLEVGEVCTLPMISAIRERLQAIDDPEVKTSSYTSILQSSVTRVDPAYLVALIGPVLLHKVESQSESDPQVQQIEEAQQDNGSEVPHSLEEGEGSAAPARESSEGPNSREVREWVLVETGTTVQTSEPPAGSIPRVEGRCAYRVATPTNPKKLREFFSSRGVDVHEVGNSTVLIIPTNRIAKTFDQLKKRFSGKDICKIY